MSARPLCLAFLALTGHFLEAQADPSCFNGGFVNTSSSACVCLAGFGGADCSSAQCGGNPFDVARSVVGAGSSINDCSCDAGWTGIGCDICASLTSCDSSFKAAGGQYPSQSSSSPNATLTCNSAPVVVNVGSASCNVNVRIRPVCPFSLVDDDPRTRLSPPHSGGKPQSLSFGPKIPSVRR